MSLTISPARIVEESRSPLLAAPGSWPRRRVAEVATILNGFAFKSKQFVPDGGKPLIRIRDIFNDHTAVGYVGEYDKRYLVQPGELVVGMDGDFNSARWRGPEALLNQRVCKITPDPNKLDPDFLTYVLPGYLKAIHDLTSSTTVTHLSSRDVADIPIPVPPLREQRELVHVLMAADSERLSSIAHLQAARRAIERLRQAVLATACSGRLTADWRGENPGGSPARDLVGRISEARLSRLGSRYKSSPDVSGVEDLPESWCWTSIGSLVEVATGATPLRKRTDYYGGDIPWVTSGAVNAGVITEPSEWITELALKETNAKLFPAGTLLVAMYGEGQTRGRVAELGIEAATNQAVAGLLFDEITANLRPYLKLFLLENYERIRSMSFGGVQPNLSLAAISQTLVPLPPLAEQAVIVRRANRLLTVADSLSVRLGTAARQVNRFFQSVLAKAFRGELSAQMDFNIVPKEGGLP